MTTEIYIQLKNEGTEVWKPVTADWLTGQVFKIIDINVSPKTESWKFNFGDSVICEEKIFQDGTKRLVAVKKYLENKCNIKVSASLII